MNSNSDIAIISVITSGIIAVAGVLIPYVVNLILDSQKWYREQKASELERLNTTTTQLLNKIAETSNSFYMGGRSGNEYYPTYAECIGIFLFMATMGIRRRKSIADIN